MVIGFQSSDKGNERNKKMVWMLVHIKGTIYVKDTKQGGMWRVRSRRKEDAEKREKQKAEKAPYHKQKRRFQPCTMALREIRRFQKSTDLLICNLTFPQ